MEKYGLFWFLYQIQTFIQVKHWKQARELRAAHRQNFSEETFYQKKLDSPELPVSLPFAPVRALGAMYSMCSLCATCILTAVFVPVGQYLNYSPTLCTWTLYSRAVLRHNVSLNNIVLTLCTHAELTFRPSYVLTLCWLVPEYSSGGRHCDIITCSATPVVQFKAFFRLLSSYFVSHAFTF